MKKNCLAVFLLLFVVTLCLAAEIAGKWVGKLRTPDGNEFPITYVLKPDGSKLNGSVVIPDAELPITNGKVNGEGFSFTVNYQGTDYLNEGSLTGDSLKVKVHFGNEVIETTLKKEN